MRNGSSKKRGDQGKWTTRELNLFARVICENIGASSIVSVSAAATAALTGKTDARCIGQRWRFAYDAGCGWKDGGRCGCGIEEAWGAFLPGNSGGGRGAGGAVLWGGGGVGGARGGWGEVCGR